MSVQVHKPRVRVNCILRNVDKSLGVYFVQQTYGRGKLFWL